MVVSKKVLNRGVRQISKFVGLGKLAAHLWFRIYLIKQKTITGILDNVDMTTDTGGCIELSCVPGNVPFLGASFDNSEIPPPTAGDVGDDFVSGIFIQFFKKISFYR